MRPFSIVGRELRVAARRPNTYRVRVAFAVAALLILGWLVVVAGSVMSLAQQGRWLFNALAAVSFVYCLFVGVRATADCMSGEKRDGTIGLLFLTPLKGRDVVLGKLVSSSINTVYGLLAALPVLSLVLLLGGVTMPDVLRASVLLLNTLFFSLAAGVFVSTVSQDERRAGLITLLLLIVVAVGPLVLVTFLSMQGVGPPVGVLTFLSPVVAFIESLKTGRGGPDPMMWLSVAVTHLTAWLLLSASARMLPKLCRDRPDSRRRQKLKERWREWSAGNAQVRTQHRSRLLNRNPFLWLAARDRLKPALVWLFVGSMFALWVLVFTQYRDLSRDWFLSGVLSFIVIGFIKLWYAVEVCSRFIEDRRSGALELLLSCPLSEAEIARGQAWALRRQFALPLALLFGGVWWLFWRAGYGFFTDLPVSTIRLSCGIALVVAIADLMALKWVGMWTASRTQSVSRAILAAVWRVLLLPWVLFSAAMMAVVLWTMLRSYWAGTGGGLRNLDPKDYALIWGGISLAVACFQGWRARRQFLRHFRESASQAYSPVGWRGLGKGARARGGVSRARMSRRKRWAIASAVGLIVVLASGFVWRKHRLNLRVEERLQRVRDAGYPTDQDELIAWDKGVAANGLEAAELLRSVASDANFFNQRRPLLEPGEEAPLGLLTRFGTMIRKESASIRKMNELKLEKLPAAALEVPNGFQPWSSGGSVLFQTVLLVKIAYSESLLANSNADVARSLEALEGLWRLSRALEQGPSPVGVRVYYHQSVAYLIKGLERLASRMSLTEEELAPWPERLLKLSESDGLKMGVAVERLALIESNLSGDPTARQSPIVMGGPPRSDAVRASVLKNLLEATGVGQHLFIDELDQIEAVIRALELPYPARMEATRELAQTGANPRAGIARATESALAAESIAVGWLRAAATALAVERFRLARGRLPEDLSELVPAIFPALPADPFTGGPLRYRRNSEGFKVYSVGPDLEDDSGEWKPVDPNWVWMAASGPRRGTSDLGVWILIFPENKESRREGDEE